MKKRFLSILMLFLPILASADPVEIDGIWYNLITKGKVASVTKCLSGKYSGDIVIPETVTYNDVICNVTSIEYEAFRYNDDITSVKIPDNVKNIGANAFYNCSRLTSVTIGGGVTNIDSDAFYACGALKAVYIKDLEAWLNINFANSFSNPLCCAQKLYLNNSEVTELVIPTGMTGIGKNTFINCSSLVSISIPNSVTSIGEYAFAGCCGLTSITIPNNVSSIGDYAFHLCSGVTTLIIGSGLTSYGSYAFAYCKELKNVTFLASSINSGYNNVFEGSLIEYADLYLPIATFDIYKDQSPWKNFQNIYAIPDSESSKCATPTIKYENGKIKFSCETEGVEFVSTIASGDSKNYYGGEITLSNKYTVTVYATKTGCYNSDTATLEIVGSAGSLGDLNGDGEVNVADHVELSKIILNQE